MDSLRIRSGCEILAPALAMGVSFIESSLLDSTTFKTLDL